MTKYFLKTSNKCNNNCLYCDSLKKKYKKEKSLKEIKLEINEALNEGFTTIKYSCNTDTRNDFADILKYAKRKKLKNILETNARVFCYTKLLKEVDKYVDKFEVYFSFGYPEKARFINDVENGFFEQSILGLRNLINKVDAKKILVKIVVMNLNINEIKRVIRNVVSLGVLKIQFIHPFNLDEKNKLFPSINGMVKVMPQFLEYASQLGTEVKFAEELEYNPFKTKELKLLDEKLSFLKFEKKIFSQKPKISVVIPTINKSKYLKLVLGSFFTQDTKKSDYEIIVIDDGGDKNTEKMIKSLSIKCNLKYIYWPRAKHKENKLISKYSNFYNRAGLARNIGVCYADGEILLFSDDDIIVAPDNLKQHLSKHFKNKNLIVRAYRKHLLKGYLPNDYSIKNIDKKSKDELSLDKRILKCRKFETLKEGWENFVTCNLSISKKLFEDSEGFKNDSPFWGLEDVELGYRLKKFNPILDWNSDVIVYHLWHEPQTIDEHKKYMTFWINTNIFFRKYFDPQIYEIYLNTILNNFNKEIFR